MSSSISYTVSEQDYLAAMRLYGKCAPFYSRFMPHVFVLQGFVSLYFGLSRSSLGLTLVGVIYILLPWWIRWLVTTPLIQRNYRQYPAMHLPQTMSVLDSGEGLFATSAGGESRLLWSLIIQWCENDEFMLIFIQPRLFFIVPKSADPEAQLLPRIRQLLTQHVGAPRYTTEPAPSGQ